MTRQPIGRLTEVAPPYPFNIPGFKPPVEDRGDLTWAEGFEAAGACMAVLIVLVIFGTAAAISYPFRRAYSAMSAKAIRAWTTGQ